MTCCMLLFIQCTAEYLAPMLEGTKPAAAVAPRIASALLSSSFRPEQLRGCCARATRVNTEMVLVDVVSGHRLCVSDAIDGSSTTTRRQLDDNSTATGGHSRQQLVVAAGYRSRAYILTAPRQLRGLR